MKSDFTRDTFLEKNLELFFPNKGYDALSKVQIFRKPHVGDDGFIIVNTMDDVFPHSFDVYSFNIGPYNYCETFDSFEKAEFFAVNNII